MGRLNLNLKKKKVIKIVEILDASPITSTREFPSFSVFLSCLTPKIR